MHHLAKVAWGFLTGGSNPPLSVAMTAARPVSPGARRVVLSGMALVVAGLAACSAPRWQVDAGPEDTRLFVDGRARSSRRIEGPIPYYGVVDLAVVPDLDARSPDRIPLRTHRAKLAIDEPVTPWIFPFDFVLEMLEAPFVDDPVPHIELTAPPRDDLATPGTSAPGIEAFLVRARAAATAR